MSWIELGFLLFFLCICFVFHGVLIVRNGGYVCFVFFLNFFSFQLFSSKNEKLEEKRSRVTALSSHADRFLLMLLFDLHY